MKTKHEQCKTVQLLHLLGWNQYQSHVNKTSKSITGSLMKKQIFLNIIKNVCVICSPQRELVIFLFGVEVTIQHIFFEKSITSYKRLYTVFSELEYFSSYPKK